MTAARLGFVAWHELVLATALVVFLIVAALLDPRFASPAVQIELASHSFEILLLAVPATFIIIAGGIDLSIGATMAVAAVVLGAAFERGASTSVAIALALAAGATAGALNALVIVTARVHPLVVTLASMSAYRGLAEGLSRGRSVSGFPESFSWLGQGSLMQLPVAGLVAGLVFVGGAVTLARGTLGRRVRAIGCGEVAARYSGLAVDRITSLLYVGSGVAAALAAVLFVARRNTAKADIGWGIELDVITAVMLGGASVRGGAGSLSGTLLGVLLLHELREFVSWRWQNDELILILTGALLIAAMMVRRRTA